jgi:AdoMet-dependent rRNA methyltransferase SPB1
MALKMATEWLVAGGTFVTKVFRSRDYNKIIYILNKFFGRVQVSVDFNNLCLFVCLFVW